MIAQTLPGSVCLLCLAMFCGVECGKSLDGFWADGFARPIVGPGFNNQVAGMAESGGSRFVVGAFTEVCGISAEGVARWDGSAWSAVGTCLRGDAYAMTVWDGQVFVSGRFALAEETPFRTASIALERGPARSLPFPER